MDYQTWLTNCPDHFPTTMERTSPNHNSVVGMTREDTLNNVQDILTVVHEMFLFSNEQDHSVEFSEKAATGFACIISCVIDALSFEIRGRSDSKC